MESFDEDKEAINNFSIPYALSPDGVPTAASVATKGILYKCPNCLTVVTLRAGKIKRAHYAHKHQGRLCNNETVIHATAKVLIKDRLANGEPVYVFARCRGASKGFRAHQMRVSLDSVIPFTEVGLEKTLPSGRRPDVLVSNSGSPVLAIEIFVTHRLSAEKIKDLSSGSDYMELSGSEVIERFEKADYFLSPLGGSVLFSDLECPRCVELEQLEAKRAQISKAKNEILPKYYCDVYRSFEKALKDVYPQSGLYERREDEFWLSWGIDHQDFWVVFGEVEYAQVNKHTAVDKPVFYASVLSSRKRHAQFINEIELHWPDLDPVREKYWPSIREVVLLMMKQSRTVVNCFALINKFYVALSEARIIVRELSSIRDDNLQCVIRCSCVGLVFEITFDFRYAESPDIEVRFCAARKTRSVRDPKEAVSYINHLTMLLRNEYLLGNESPWWLAGYSKDRNPALAEDFDEYFTNYRIPEAFR